MSMTQAQRDANRMLTLAEAEIFAALIAQYYKRHGHDPHPHEYDAICTTVHLIARETASQSVN